MSYPTDPEFQAIDVKLNYNNVKSQTRSGRTQVRNIGAALWSFTAKYNNLTRDEMGPVVGFIAATQGGSSSFTIVPPVISSTRGTASGTLLANGASSAGDRTVPVDGISGTLKAGDFIKFANHTKVYMLTNDISGSGTMTIEPALHEAVSNNEAVTYNSVPFTMRVARDVQRFQLSGFDQYQVEVDFIEAI
jgi:hypothetical protein